MTETLLNQGGDDPLQDVKALVANWMKCLSDMQQALEENEQLRQRVAALESENAQKDEEIKNLSTELQEKERKLTELGKLSASMAKKSPQDDVAKAIRIYMNTSKRKTLSKREAAKTVLLELITAAKLEMPEDTMELLNHFDDEVIVEQPAEEPSRPLGVPADELLTAEAMELWELLRQAGFIAKDSFALAQGVSANQATYIAMLTAERLGLKKKWKPFQDLWGIPNMAQMAGAWQQTGKLPPDAKRIDELLE